MAGHRQLHPRRRVCGGGTLALAAGWCRPRCWCAALCPAVVSGVYVRPNEISIERPYIQRHIQATRAAFGLERPREGNRVSRQAGIDASIPPPHQAILSNVRLWDWRAFHDTVTQIQALRPYYTFADTDVDRYMIDGQLRQVLLTPRELDIRQLPEAARSRWINPHFIYTHGYGLVMAEANRITADGLPVLFIQDAPPVVKTQQPEADAPRDLLRGSARTSRSSSTPRSPSSTIRPGADNVFARYEGKGGFPVSSLAMRVAAAVDQADPNILLTSYLTPESRMMIRRNVRERLAGARRLPHLGYRSLPGHHRGRPAGLDRRRLHHLASASLLAQRRRWRHRRRQLHAQLGQGHRGCLRWRDPHLHLRSRRSDHPGLPAPFPETASSRLRRCPPTCARTPAIPRCSSACRPRSTAPTTCATRRRSTTRKISGTSPAPWSAQTGRPAPMVAHLRGGEPARREHAEFLLIIPFTPRNKDNLIGLMVARCDGEHLGELVVLQLSKQELIFGPMQIEARINQDQTISKDLTLWNQQGSQVLRGQMLVLPIGNTFLYVEPIYIQASEARMPQLKKVVLAMGNLLIYADTYEQALAQLTATMQGAAQAAAQATTPAAPAAAPAGAPGKPAVIGANDRAHRCHPHAPPPLPRPGRARPLGRGGQGARSDRCRG